MARFDGTNSPGHGPSFDPAQSAGDAALDGLIDGSLHRRFSVPPIAPLPFGPMVPTDPATAGASGAGGLLAKLIPTALSAREVASLVAAAVLWSAAGVLIYNALDLPSFGRRAPLQGGAWSARVASAATPDGGMIDRYEELLENPPTAGDVALVQEARWDELREAFDRWPDTPFSDRLRRAAEPGNPVRDRVELIQVRRGQLLGVNAAFVSGRVDGALFVAVLDVPNSASMAMVELSPGARPRNAAAADARYFAARDGEIVAYELTTGSEARFVPALLRGAAPRMEPVR